MRVLFVSGELIGSALCHKLISEGNEVRLYIHKEDWKNCLNGIIQKTKDWKDELEWVGKEGLIVFDDVLFGEEQDILRASGYKVVGGSKGGDTLELDRRHFQEIAIQCGIQTLPSFNFSSAQEAINFVENNRSRWVVKQNTHLSSLNFVGHSDDGADVIRVLTNYKKRNISPVHLQQFAEGIEVGVARYFNGNDWVGPIEINHEHKRLEPGDRGPLTPEMGTVLWYTENEVRLFKEALEGLKPHLQNINFRGDIDVNCIVNADKIMPLEATPRFGSPSTEIQVALHSSPWASFLTAVADQKPYSLEYRKQFGIGVCLVVPPFPYAPDPQSKLRTSQQVQEIVFQSDITDEDRVHIHFEEVALEGGKYIWAGYHGWVLHVTATADTLTEARTIVYERIRKIKMEGSFYRQDIGHRVDNHDLKKLKDWGWV